MPETKESTFPSLDRLMGVSSVPTDGAQGASFQAVRAAVLMSEKPTLRCPLHVPVMLSTVMRSSDKQEECGWRHADVDRQSLAALRLYLGIVEGQQ